jgi:hypothetical protein
MAFNNRGMQMTTAEMKMMNKVFPEGFLPG